MEEKAKVHRCVEDKYGFYLVDAPVTDLCIKVNYCPFCGEKWKEHG